MEVAAISVDSAEESNKLRASQGYTFTFLSDPKAEVIRRYGVLHAGEGEAGRDIARPAEFLVDSTGAIRWVNLTDDLRIRARPENVLKAIDSLMPAQASAQRTRRAGRARAGRAAGRPPAYSRLRRAKARAERLDERGIGLVALGGERALEIREHAGPEPLVGLGPRDDLVDAKPSQR